MRSKLIFLFTFIALTSWAKAEDSIVVNPSDYRKGKTEKPTDSFSDLVKLIRISEGEWDVFFEKKGGPFNIPGDRDNTGALQQAASTAYTKKKNLKVSIDPKDDVILSAEIDNTASEEAAGGEASGKKAPVVDYNKVLEETLKSINIGK